MTEYEDVIEAAIAKMIKTVNKDVALRQARTVPDLDVDDDGNVKELRAPGKEVLRELVDVFSDIMGGVAESLIAYELRDSFDLDELELPESVSEHL